MKTLILYCSKSHGNTKKLVDAIVAAHPGEVDTIDAQTLEKNATVDFSDYLLIGVASGIYYSNFDKSVREPLSRSLRDGDNVFALMTYGGETPNYSEGIQQLCMINKANYLGAYGCNAFTTFGILKIRGGLLKDHPTEKEIQGAVDFYDALVWNYGDTLEERRAQRDAQDAYDAAHPKKGIVGQIKGVVSKVAAKRSGKAGAGAEADDAAADVGKDASAAVPDVVSGDAVAAETVPVVDDDAPAVDAVESFNPAAVIGSDAMAEEEAGFEDRVVSDDVEALEQHVEGMTVSNAGVGVKQGEVDDEVDEDERSALGADGASDGAAPDAGMGGAVSDEASPGGADAKAAAAPEGDAVTGPVAGSGAAGAFAGTGLADDATVGSEVAAGSEAADGTAPDAGIAEDPAEGQA